MTDDLPDRLNRLEDVLQQHRAGTLSLDDLTYHLVVFVLIHGDHRVRALLEGVQLGDTLPEPVAEVVGPSTGRGIATA